jgi:hypothetical protein
MGTLKLIERNSIFSVGVVRLPFSSGVFDASSSHFFEGSKVLMWKGKEDEEWPC